MPKLLRDFLRDESGATAIEYSLVAGGVALAIITVVNSLGVAVLGKYQSIVFPS